MEKKLLIAIDGSVYSDQSLLYTSLLFNDREDVTFHLVTCIRSSSALPEPTNTKNTLFPESLDHQKKLGDAQLRLKKATQKFLDLGIDSKRVTSSTINAGSNIGGAIQHEAERLLVDAIVVGRRGIGRVGEMFMGSISTTLFQKCHTVPLWIIDGEIQSSKILVPLDRTVYSLMAVDHLAHIFANRDDVSLYLFHCHKLFGKNKKHIPEKMYEEWNKRWFDRLKDEKDFLMHGSAQILIDAGISKKNIDF